MPRAITQKTNKKSKLSAKNAEESTGTIVTKKKSAEVVEELKPTTIKKAPVEEKAVEKLPVVDLEEIKKQLTEEIKKQVEFEISRKMHVEKVKEKPETLVERSQVSLKTSATEQYLLFGDADGFSISDNVRSLISSSKGGAIGVGTRSPKSHGPGSMHIKANYSSEASLPTTGKFTTRGLIVEGDSDDNTTFGMRVVSRKNRQGVNITGTGSLRIGLMSENTNSKLFAYQPVNDAPVISAYAPSRYFNSTVLNLGSQATSTNAYNFISAQNQQVSPDGTGQSVFKVDGYGAVSTDRYYATNKTAYAEMFEWADKNARKEDRIGFTVTVDNNGKLRIADEGDKVVGVVVDPEEVAVIGNTQWNYWKNKYTRDEKSRYRKQRYHVIEWENADNTLDSYFNSTVPADVPLPENALTFETAIGGADMYTNREHPSMDHSLEYVSRLDRAEWAVVALTGTVNMYKGQLVENNWIKIADVTDELERWLIR